MTKMTNKILNFLRSFAFPKDDGGYFDFLRTLIILQASEAETLRGPEIL